MEMVGFEEWEVLLEVEGVELALLAMEEEQAMEQAKGCPFQE